MSYVLVIADTLDDTPIALQRAREVAASTRAKLHIVNFGHASLRNIEGDREEIKAKIIGGIRLQASEIIEQEIPPDMEFVHEVVWSKDIHNWVKEYATANKPSMVIKTGHRSETAFYTPTDWHLIRECPAPVLIATEARWKNNTNILAAIDLETEVVEKQTLNHQILSKAKQFAALYKTDLHVCYVPPVAPVLADLGLKFADETEEKAKKELKFRIHELAEMYAIPVENFHIKAGVPERKILSLAHKTKAAMIVIGTVGRKGVTGKLIGNTAEKILQLSKSDTLTLKPD